MCRSDQRVGHTVQAVATTRRASQNAHEGTVRRPQNSRRDKTGISRDIHRSPHHNILRGIQMLDLPQ